MRVTGTLCIYRIALANAQGRLFSRGLIQPCTQPAPNGMQCATRVEVARAVAALKNKHDILVLATKSAIFNPSAYG